MKNFTNKSLVFFIILFALTTLVEKYILIRLNANAIRDHYISTTFLSIFMFLYCIKIPMVKNNNSLAIIGRKYSLHIYVVHLIFVKLYNICAINGILDYFIQILIFIVSLLVAVIYVKSKNKLLEYRKINNV